MRPIPTDDPERVRVPKTAELVAARLRGRIVRGELREGDSLPCEPLLGSRFGVSRPILREALRILEWESLIRVRRGAGGGVEVRAPKARLAARNFGMVLQFRGVTVGDLFRTRMVLEPLAARLFAEHDDGSGAKALQKLLEDEKQSLGDPKRFARLTVRFHEEIFRGCGNPIVELIGAVLRNLIESEVELELADHLASVERNKKALRKAIQEAYRAHVRLAKLVRGRKAAQAESHWRAYVESLGRYLPRNANARRINVLQDGPRGRAQS